MRDWISQNFGELRMQARLRFGQHGDDILQEACLRSLKVKQDGDPMGWFATVMRRIYIDRLKNQDNVLTSIDAPPPGEEDASSWDIPVCDKQLDSLTSERKLLLMKIGRCMRRIGTKNRKALELAYMGYERKKGRRKSQATATGSYELAALVMDCPVNTVRSRLSRARAAFIKEWNRKAGRPKGGHL